MIHFQCPGCKAEFEVADEAAGKRGKCSQCGAEVLIPAAGTAAAALAAPSGDVTPLTAAPASVTPAAPTAPAAFTPAADALQWFYTVGGRQYGPAPTATLRQALASGQVPAATLVWRQGMPNWLPATTVPELQSSLPAGGAAYAYSPGPAQAVPYTSPYGQPQGGRGAAIASLVLGLVSLVVWIVPVAGSVIGLITSIIGLVLGIKGRGTPGRGMAIAGIVLSILGLVGNVAVGIFWGYVFHMASTTGGGFGP